MDFTIRNYRPEDWAGVHYIYQAGIETGLATFEPEVKSQKAFEEDSIAGCILVAENPKGGIYGWATLWPVSQRSCYSGVTEVSVYVNPKHQGKGVGEGLLNALIKRSELKGIWTLQAGIFEENMASERLHEKCGFRHIGIRERLGQLNGQWHNIVIMERRSDRVGT